MEVVENVEKTAKKTYKKHKTGKKISVVHFLNSKVKPNVFDSVLYYPLYVRITKDRKNTTLRSLIWGYFSDEMLKNEKVLHALSLERTYILSLLKGSYENNTELFDAKFQEFSIEYRKNSNVLKDVIHNFQLKSYLEIFKNYVIKSKGSFDASFYEIFDFYGRKTFADIDKDPNFFLDLFIPTIILFFEEMNNNLSFDKKEIELIISKKDYTSQFQEYIKNVG